VKAIKMNIIINQMHQSLMRGCDESMMAVEMSDKQVSAAG